MERQTVETDVVVVGGGMAGLAAALSLTDRDVGVTVLEKGPRPGGSMYLSNGAVWTYPTFEVAREYTPTGNEELQRLVVERLPDALDWVGEHYDGLRDLPEQYAPEGGWQGNLIDPTTFTKHVVEHLRQRGNEVRLRTPMTDLRVDPTGAVVGVEADAPDGEWLLFDAEAVLLATGGWQGNAALVERHLVDDANDVWLRSNPWSTGDGVIAAHAAGAKLTRGWGSFYGHNMAAPPAMFDLAEIADATQYYGAAAVALDSNGQRFTDESESDMENTLAQDTARRADGTAYYVVDQTLYESNQFGGHVGTQIDRAEDLGAPVVRADSLESLPGALEGLDLNADRAVETLREFNDAMRSGPGDTLVPPRNEQQRLLDTPPFYVVEVRPGITFTNGGLDVTHDMQVLDRRGTGSSLDHYPADASDVIVRPIPGLYAAGADVGNVNNRHYLGGLAVALVTGRIAGRSAAEVVSGS